MKVDIAIITLRDDEFSAVFDRLEEYLSEMVNGSSGRTYAIVSVPTTAGKTCTVALARSPEQGNDISQQVASDIIRDLDPQLLSSSASPVVFPKENSPSVMSSSPHASTTLT